MVRACQDYSIQNDARRNEIIKAPMSNESDKTVGEAVEMFFSLNLIFGL
jgi:hypothetical protein